MITPLIRNIDLEIGFDRANLTAPANRDHPLLAQGCTKVGVEEGNPVATARMLQITDRMRITIYDLTTANLQPDPIHGMSFTIEFYPAYLQKPQSPVDSRLFDSFTIHWGGKLPSAVFESDPLPAWHVVTPGVGGTYPHNQLEPGSAGDKTVFTLRHEGAFYYTLLLKVVMESGAERIYRVDPEMLVGNNSPGGGVSDDAAGARGTPAEGSESDSGT
jgi:hypothetical protein